MWVVQSYLTLCDPIDCSPPDSSVQGILQARILEWVVIPFSRGSSWPKEWTQVSCIAGRFFTVRATQKGPCTSPQPVNLWTQEHTDRGRGSWVLILPLQTPSVILEKAMAPHSSTLAWRIPWMGEHGRLKSMGSLRLGHDWATSLSFFTFMHWRRKWQPTLVFLPGESQG